MKILFAGSPEAALITLKSLYDSQKQSGFEIAGVLSNPPSAKGRHSEKLPTPVAAFALGKNIPLFEPEHLDSTVRAAIKPLGAELLVSFAYGHIFGPKFLGMFPLGGINLHPSLLPKYRGCTPVQAAILNRDTQTGIAVQKLSLKMDEGDILKQSCFALTGEETTQTLLEKAAVDGACFIKEIIEYAQKNGSLPEGKPQQGEPSYTGIITKDDGKINWREEAGVIQAKVRALFPEPGCWCLEKNVPLRILGAQFIDIADERAKKYEEEPCGKVLDFIKAEGIYIKTGSGILVVSQLQRQGKKIMNYKDFMNGARDFVGTVLE